MDISDFKLPSAGIVSQPEPRTKRRQTEPFLKGPVPMSWLNAACTIRRKNALAASLVIFHMAGLARSNTALTVTARRAKQVMGLGKKFFDRGLRDLEAAGLVRVERSRGRAAVVDIIHKPEMEASNDS